MAEPERAQSEMGARASGGLGRNRWVQLGAGSVVKVPAREISVKTRREGRSSLRSGSIVLLGHAWYFLVYAWFLRGNKKKRD